MKEKLNLNNITEQLSTILENLIMSTKQEIEVFIDLDTEDIIKNVNYKHENMKKYTHLMEELTMNLQVSDERTIEDIKMEILRIEELTKELKYHNLKLKTIMSPVVDIYKSL